MFYQKIKSKRFQLCILLLSILIFFILCFLYDKFMLNSKCVFVLKKDVSKGEKLTYDTVQKVIVKNCEQFEQEELVYPYDSVAKYNLKKGQILNYDIISKEDIKLLKETIVIPLNNNSYNVKKGKFVNIYITTNKENVVDKNIKCVSLTNKNSRETTIKIIENKEVFDVYKDSENRMYIVVEVEKDVALFIENVKDISKFSMSIIEGGD